MKPNSRWIFAAWVVVANVAACKSVTDSSVVSGLEDADRLWAGGSAVCARTTSGLKCFGSNETKAVEVRPIKIDGVGRVSTVAMSVGQACAVDEQGVVCFSTIPLDGKSVRRTDLIKPTNVVNLGMVGRDRFCATDANGLACWKELNAPSEHVPDTGLPEQMLASLVGDALCLEEGGNLTCYTLEGSGALTPTFTVKGVHGVKQVSADTISGKLVFLDDTGLKWAQVQTLTLRGNPFGYVNPLEVPADVAPVRGAVVTARPVEGLGVVRGFSSYSIWSYVLDDSGLKKLDIRFDGAHLEPVALERVPEGMWGGKDSVVFLKQGPSLMMTGWSNGKRIEGNVAGIRLPRDVAAGLFFTCVAHDGGVSCVKNPE